MSNLITHCLERLNLEDADKVKARAEQFYGQLSSLPVKLFDKGPNLKAAISIQLAYESLGHHDWSIKLACQLAGCTASAYDTALSNVRKQLNIQPSVTFDSLCVVLGSTTMLNPVRELWESFNTTYLEQFKGIKRANAEKELELPCWKGAVMYCCAKAFGESLSREKVHSLCTCSLAELKKCIKIVQTNCEKKILELKNRSSKPTRVSRRSTTTTQVPTETKVIEQTQTSTEKKKRKRATFDSTVLGALPKSKPMPKSGIVSMINQQDYKKSKRYADYVSWKSALVERLVQ